MHLHAATHANFSQARTTELRGNRHGGMQHGAACRKACVESPVVNLHLRGRSYPEPVMLYNCLHGFLIHRSDHSLQHTHRPSQNSANHGARWASPFLDVAVLPRAGQQAHRDLAVRLAFREVPDVRPLCAHARFPWNKSHREGPVLTYMYPGSNTGQHHLAAVPNPKTQQKLLACL